MAVVYNLDIDSKIILVQSDKKYIEELKKIIPSLAKNCTIEEKKVGIYEMTFKSIKNKVPKLLVNPAIVEIYNEKETEEEIIDFEESNKFYKYFKENEEIGIITDEFSNFRNKKIYEGFMSVEEKIRELIILKSTHKSIKMKPSPSNKENKIMDYIICQYGLSEIFELFLYCPASNKFIRQKWEESTKDGDSVIDLIKLKKLDELNFPLRKNELKKMKSCRNSCMHFRALSVSEYSKVVKIINKYLKFDFKKQIESSMSGISFSSLISDIIKTQNHFSEIISAYQTNMVDPFVKFASEYQKTLQAMGDVFSMRGILPQTKNDKDNKEN